MQAVLKLFRKTTGGGVENIPPRSAVTGFGRGGGLCTEAHRFDFWGLFEEI